MANPSVYPPRLAEEQVDLLLSCVADYQLTHGSLIKIPRLQAQLHSAVPFAHAVGMSAFPSLFPRRLFDQALELQPLFNDLYANVAEDDEWLGATLADLIAHDGFTAKLWSIWEHIRDEGEVQPLRCGIWRSDYMVTAVDDATLPNRAGTGALLTSGPCSVKLAQVEFNSYSCAGSSHSEIAVRMHQYLASRGAHMSSEIQRDRLPTNNNVAYIANALRAAHQAYGSPVSSAKHTAILMTVQPNNVNIADERPIEYRLLECEPPILLYRVEFSSEVAEQCTLGPRRELLFRPPLTNDLLEISVIYHRAGYEPHEYDDQGVETRLMLERSRAIKCPPILSHLSGFKRVQQQLAMPGELRRFVENPESARKLHSSFGRLFPMDSSEEGLCARNLATVPETARSYILKPSLDGGGHNIHGADIPEFLKAVPRETWGNYILMEKIPPVPIENLLVSRQGIHEGPVVSELGVYGNCLWRRATQDTGTQVLTNKQAGWSFKTKPSDVNEMSVIKGFGCFDCPCLVDQI